jgi:hypothetical protein
MPGRAGALARSFLEGGATSHQEAATAVANYLIGKTQLIYGKQNASKFSQDYGKLVSMFAKWTSTVVGEVYDKGMAKEAGYLTAKYFGPLVTLMALNSQLDSVMDDDNPMRRLALGKNLIDISPAMALKVNTPPAISVPMALGKAGYDVMKGASEGAPLEALQQGASSVYKTLTPFIPAWGQVEQAWKNATGEHIIGAKE